MRSKRRRGVEALKSVLIAVLALGAVYLALRTQGIDLFRRGGRWLGGTLPLLGGEEPLGTWTVPIYPARVVVTNEDLLRYGAQYDPAVSDALYSDVFSVLGEALSTAGAPQTVSETVWRRALTERSGAYFDFLGNYPLDALLHWLEPDAQNSALTGTARRILLAEDRTGGALLYYHNASDGSYYACNTAGSVLDHLLTAVGGQGGGGLKYAFEYDDPVYRALDPYVLIDSRPPTPGVYRGENPLGTPDSREAVWELLSSMDSALRFQTQSGTPYQTGTGEWVVNDGEDQLRLSQSGVLHFSDGGGLSPRYPVTQAGAVPTAAELLDAVQPILAGTVGASCGEARVYLIGLERLEDGWQADFGYSLSGAEVAAADGLPAARFRLKNGRVEEFSLRFRTYTATGETTPLLPERLAAAAAGLAAPGGGELVLCYRDTAAGDVRAGWSVKQRPA